MKQSKLPFKEVFYDEKHICWGVGNDAVSLNLLARIKLRELNRKEERALKKNYDQAKKIYGDFINKGQRFKAIGEKANKGIVCKITFINSETQLVSWKQINAIAPYKPAAGKFLINSFIRMYQLKEIDFISS